MAENKLKIVKVPFSGGGLGHGDGSNKAPEIIIKQLENIFSNEDGSVCKFKIDDSLIDLDERNISESHTKIEEKSEKNIEKSIYVGGDHSITYPLIKGFMKNKNKEEIQLIVFDAHPDLMEDFNPPTQEDYLRSIIEQRILIPENVFIFGLRNWDGIELNFLKSNNIRYLSCNDIFERGFKKSIKELSDWIKGDFYLSIDIDVVDPVEAIGTGYIEHGGLSSRELIYAIQRIKKKGNLLMADIVEVNPEKDINDITSILAAKLIGELFN